MIGIRHGNRSESLRSIASWSRLSTRPVSSASLAIDIATVDDTQTELNECSPLLVNQWRRGNYYPDYGIRSEQTNLEEHEQRESIFLSLNNHDRCNVGDSTLDGGASSKQFPTSMYYYEAKPHLCSIRLFGVLFILVSGLFIATYLMIVESRLPTLSFALDLVNHDIWSKMPIPRGSLLKNSSFLDVFIIHTGGVNCDSSVSCINILKDMQTHQTSNQFEMPYNFLVADDGQTYEVRGWNHESGYKSLPQESQDSSLVIGFIGNYTNIAPSTVILQSALSLVKESVRRKKLLREYRIYGIRNITAAENDAEELFEYISKWPRFERLLEVL